jgi:hypothetical protein
MAALDRVRRGTPGGTQFVDLASINPSATDEPPALPLRERIARTNLETVRRAGVGALSACFEAIESDRARTYRALEAREAGTAQATP